LTVVPTAGTGNRVVKSQPEMDAVFHALAGGPRRELLATLAGGERTVGDIA
jgi:DNA-binding transcriptional ArsR family regulator